MIIDDLRLTYEKNRQENTMFVRNLLKEQLQYFVLNHIYNSAYANSFVFKGGTCLRFCFDLPRLSEDLDFDVANFKSFSFEDFSNSLLKYFHSKLVFKDVTIKISGQNKMMYLRFPVLQEIGYPVNPDKPNDNVLFVRIDLAPLTGHRYNKEISLKSTYDFSFLIRRYSLPDLFAGKLLAVLQRQTKEGVKIEPRFKGRDYFDIYWFLENKALINFEYLTSLSNIKSRWELQQKFDEKINQALKRKQFLKNDLLPFFQEPKFVTDFINNMNKFDWTLFHSKQRLRSGLLKPVGKI